MRLRRFGLPNLFDDQPPQLFQLSQLFFTGGGADMAQHFLSDLFALADGFYDLHSGAGVEFFHVYENA